MPSKFFINDVYFLSLKKKKYYINDGECIEDFSDITDTQQFFGLTYYSHKIYSKKQRLWRFLTIHYFVDKQKFCELKSVKNSSKE